MRTAPRFVLVVCLFFASRLYGQAPIVENEVRHDTSAPLGGVPAAPREVITPRIRPIERVPTRTGRARALVLDAVEQLAPGPAAAFTAAVPSIDGLGRGLDGKGFQMTSVPPDTTGAIGTTQYVQAVNTSLLVIDKATRNIVLNPVLLKTVWKGFGGACETENDGDPIVLFDRIAKRWVITQFQVSQGHSQCVAISTTDDALGSYHRYEFSYPAMNDYPKMGVWPDAYYITFNMFQGLSGARACAYERTKMLSGAAARQVCFQLGSSFWSLMPADFTGTKLPPSGAPNPMVSLGDDSKSLDVWRFHVDWANPASSTLGTGANHAPDFNIPVAAFNDACQGSSCIPQGGTTQRLDSLGDRLMMPGVYRAFNDHESLLVNHSVQSSNATAAVRWYEIRKATGSPQLFQQGTFSPDALSRWMGSVAMDAGGNVLAGYAVAGSATKTGIRVAGRTPGDPVGVLSGELTVASGTKSQTGAGRWGDYSHMSVDPVDDCTFWYTTELMNGPNSGTFEWSTKIAAFRFAGCTAGGGGGGGGGAGGTAARIVFVSSRDGNREIYSMDSDGNNVTRLTSNPAADYSPAPSADGKRILFVSERDGRPQIYSMNTDGTDQRRLAASNAADEQPAALPKTMSAISMEMPDSATRELEMAPVPVATTAWGGDGAALRVSPRGLEIEFACANATLDSPLPASGAFDIPATYYEQRPGPVRSDLPQGPPQSARVVGRVDANRIEFRVVLPNGRVVAENQLERGRAARVVKCVSP